MKTVYGLVALVLGLVAPAGRADDKTKDYDKKIVGTWLLTKETEGIAKGTPFEFTKDGKLKASFEVGGMKIDLNGTYTVKGDKLTVTIKGPMGQDMTDTDTIKELTDTKLVIEDKDGKKIEFEKKK